MHIVYTGYRWNCQEQTLVYCTSTACLRTLVSALDQCTTVVTCSRCTVGVVLLCAEFMVMGARDAVYCSQLLTHLVDMAAMLDEQVPVVDDFLSWFLQTWNGVQFRRQVLRLIEHSKLRPFEGGFISALHRVVLNWLMRFRYALRQAIN